MLKKALRLPAEAIQRVRDGALHRERGTKSLTFETFTIKARANSLGYNRFGVVVGRRSAALSTERNRLKRVFMNCIQEHLKGSSDVLIVVSPGARQASREKIEEDIARAADIFSHAP